MAVKKKRHYIFLKELAEKYLNKKIPTYPYIIKYLFPIRAHSYALNM